MSVVRRTSLLVVILLAGLVSFSCKKKFDPRMRIASGDVPSATELDQFVSGAGGVRLAMTEDEVSGALGARPLRRSDATSRGEAVDVAWDNIGGAHPGAALGHFVAGKLFAIEFATASKAMPRISADVARSLESGDVVRRSVARTLRIEDVERATGSRGLRVRWIISHRPPDRANVMSVWAWEVEPGGRALVVKDENGLAGQPIVRDFRR
jgi:hypothetical protein